MLPCPPHRPYGDSLHLPQPWFLCHSVDWSWTLRPLEPRVIQNTLFLILPKFYTASLQRNTELLLLPSGIVFMESRFNVLSSSFTHSWKKKYFMCICLFISICKIDVKFLVPVFLRVFFTKLSDILPQCQEEEGVLSLDEPGCFLLLDNEK